jgi:hypothetical protein
VGGQSAALNSELETMAEYMARVSGRVLRCQLYATSSVTVINEEKFPGEVQGSKKHCS